MTNDNKKKIVTTRFAHLRDVPGANRMKFEFPFTDLEAYVDSLGQLLLDLNVPDKYALKVTSRPEVNGGRFNIGYQGVVGYGTFKITDV